MTSLLKTIPLYKITALAIYFAFVSRRSFESQTTDQDRQVGANALLLKFSFAFIVRQFYISIYSSLCTVKFNVRGRKFCAAVWSKEQKQD